jgi:Tat protein secretion system quality control protein TatD with DNase activity
VIDSHTHLHLCEPPDAELVEAAAEAGVTRMLTVGIDGASCRQALATAEDFPQVYAAIGRHPNSATGFDDADFAELEALVARMADAGQRLAGDELVALDLQFHQLVNERSNNRLLLEVLDSVAVYIRGFIVHTRNYWATQVSLAFVANSHRVLLAELRARDPERADRAVHHHVQSALASLMGAASDLADG